MKLNKNLLLTTALYCVLSLTSVYAAAQSDETALPGVRRVAREGQKPADFFYYTAVSGDPANSFFRIGEKTRGQIRDRLLDPTGWPEALRNKKDDEVYALVVSCQEDFAARLLNPTYAPAVPSDPTVFSDMHVISAIYGTPIDVYTQTGPTAPWTRLADVNPLNLDSFPLSFAHDGTSYGCIVERRSDKSTIQEWLEKKDHPRFVRLGGKLPESKHKSVFSTRAGGRGAVPFPQKSDEELQTDANALWLKVQDMGIEVDLNTFMENLTTNELFIDLATGSGYSRLDSEAMQRACERARQSAVPSRAPRVDPQAAQQARLRAIFALDCPRAASDWASGDEGRRQHATTAFHQDFMRHLREHGFRQMLRDRHRITETDAELLAMGDACKPKTAAEIIELIDVRPERHEHLRQDLRNADPELKGYLLERFGFIYTDAEMRRIGGAAMRDDRSPSHVLLSTTASTPPTRVDTAAQAVTVVPQAGPVDTAVAAEVAAALAASDSPTPATKTQRSPSPVESIVHSSDDESVFADAVDPKVVAYEAAEEKIENLRNMLGLTGDVLPFLRDPTQIYGEEEKTFGNFVRDLLGDAGREYTDAYLQDLARTINKDQEA